MKQSRWERLRQEIRDKGAEISRLRTELESTRATLESESKRRRELLDKPAQGRVRGQGRQGLLFVLPSGPDTQMSPEIRKLVRSLRRDGWDWKYRGNGHVLLTKGKLSLTCAATPSDGRAIRNIRAAIRRVERGGA